MDSEVAKAKEQKKTNALFVLSCARGYIEDAKTLLDRGADPDAVDKQKISGLHFACGQGRLEVVKFLWTRGIELDAEDPAGNLPLHYAVVAGKAAVVEFLLGKGAWVEGSNSLDDTPLHIAARKGHLDIVKHLLDHGAKATLRDVNKRGLTALGEAIVAGNVPVAEELVKAGANLGAKARGFPLLHLAASFGSAAAVRFLLGRGAKENDNGERKRIFSKNGMLGTAELSDSCNGISEEACLEDGNTPLHCAAEAGSLQAAKLLVEAGGDRSLSNASGKQAQDLVPGSDKQLKTLLATTAPAKGAAAIQAARAVPKNDVEDFKALDKAKRKARIERWAAVEDPQQLEKLLLEFPLELKTQIQELRKLQQILNIQQALLELVEDDDFQKLAEGPKAQEVVANVHSDPQLFRRYAEDNDIMELLRALQRFQAVVRGNGGHQIPFQSLLRTCEEGYQEKSRMRLKGMHFMVEARKRAAVAAALADSETEAKTNAAKEMELPARPASSAAPTHDTAAISQQSPIPPRDAARQTASPADRLTADFEQPRVEPSPVTGRQPVTLKLLGKEMLRALRNSLILLAVVLVVGYCTNGKAPWEGGGEGQKYPVGHAEL